MHSEMIQGRIRKLIESLFTLSSLFGANYPEFTLDKTDESIIRTSYHDSIRTYQAHRDAECHRLSEETQFISSEIDSSPFLVKEPTETSSSTTNDNHQLTAIQAEQVEHIKSSLFALMDYISKYTN